MIAPILIWERFENFGLKYASPVAVILILICLVVFCGLRWLAVQKMES
jgi:molybdate/tungstate transport system permease protein